MMNHEHKRPVTLEDLLRLKRAERPPAEFWTQFDRELRAKQLAALVERRPWWRTLPQVYAGFSRFQLPLGATAALALTILSVREYGTATPARTSDLAKRETVAVAVPVAPEIVASNSGPAREAGAMPASVSQEDEITAGAADFVLSSEATAPDHLSQIIPLLGTAPHSGAAEQENSPTARFLAANLAFVKSTGPAIAQNLLGAARGFETRAMPARAPKVDPLAQMTSPNDLRHSRLLNAATALTAASSPSPARTADRVTHRISDDRLNDSFGGRFAADGGSVSVKF
jgi:hypothetical protein